MDRRRFAPSAEGLESRALMATLAGTATSTTVPISAGSKSARIQNLPYFLALEVPGRTIPVDITQPIQEDLTAIRGKLHAPRTITLDAFNDQIRYAAGNASLDAQAARNLEVAFGKVLKSAGASAAQVEDFQADVNRLIQYDVQNPQPTFTATNDYATILQVALGVGRPIKTPGAPRLAAGSRQGGPNPHLVKEGVTQPFFVGSYTASTITKTNTMLLIDQAGSVVGSAAVGTNGTYRLRPGTPLSAGTHTFRVQAMDAAGDLSLPSAALNVTVK